MFAVVLGLHYGVGITPKEFIAPNAQLAEGPLRNKLNAEHQHQDCQASK